VRSADAHIGMPMATGPENPSPEQIQHLIRLYSEGELSEALVQARQLLQSYPKLSFLHNIQGAALVGLGQFDAAIESYRQALLIEPGDAKTYFNLGNALNDSGDAAAAIHSYEQALMIQPDYVLAHVNLGNACKDAGNLVQAIQSYHHALEIDPNFAEVYNNLGNALKDKGDLEQAIASYRQALEIEPDYAQAHNNLGTALKDKGELELARTSYRQALEIKPDYADAAWNMVGTAEDMDDAEYWMRSCLAADQDYLSAKIALGVLEFFRGDRTGFDELMKSSLRDHPTMRSMEWVSTLPSLPKLYFQRWAFFDRAIELSIQDRPFYEFGVFTGESFKYLINAFGKGFGFDTFEGLPEDWGEEKAGSYSSGGNIPEAAGGEFIVGKFEDTLPSFFSEPRLLASVINFDADLYSSTICALNFSKPVIDRHTILIFDEFIVNEHWEQDEYKALNEFCVANNYTFEVLAVSFFTKQVAVKLVGV